MKVSAWAIRNPLAPILLFAVLVMLGLWGFMRLPVTNYPRLDIPLVSITVSLDDASPDQIETEIAVLVEDAVASLAGLESISTTIDEGQAVVLLEFATSVPVDRAVSEARDAVSAIVPDLPPAAEAPVIRREVQEEAPILTYAVEMPGASLADLTWYVDDTVIRSLQGLPDIKRVERLGGADREIEIALDPLRMEALGLTVAGIAADLAREQIDTAVGVSQTGGQDRSLRISGSATSVAGLADLPLTHPAGAPVRLADVATVHDGAGDARGFALFDGRQAVGIAIIPATEASDPAAAEAAQARIARLAVESGAQFTLASEVVAFTLGNYEAAMVTLAEGAVLAVIVVFLFLRDWRATVVVALALPLSAIPTFFVIQQLGFSLNILSTLAITLVTGILVDDAIVEIENIARHQHQGKSAWRASVDASDEIGLAVIAISATIIAVFLPVGLMEGVIGQYFRQFGLTVAIAVFFSLVVARLFTPILAAYFMKNAPPEEAAEGAILHRFRRMVTLAVRWRWATMGLAAASFAGGMMMLMAAPATFLPEMDAGTATISMELPPGATLDDTAATAQAATAALRALPEVASVLVEGGRNPMGPSEVRHATLTVGFTARKTRAPITELRPALTAALAAVPDARFEVLRDGGGREVSVGVRGRDSAVTTQAAQDLLAAMRAEPMFTAPGSDMAAPRPALSVVPDRERAQDLGIAPADLVQTVRMSTMGASDADLPNFQDGARRVPIRARLSSEARNDMGVIERLAVPVTGGGTVLLGAVAQIRTTGQTASIKREGQLRQIELGADMAPGFAPGDGIAWLATYDAFPPGVGLSTTGDSENQGDTFSAFVTAMGAGITLVLIVLILLFGSVFAPLTVLAALPLSVCGVGLAQWAFGFPLSLPVVIGILMLMGIATKNSIMLVDVALTQEAAGMDRSHAAIEAAVLRVRPIVMTTIAMSAGMVPSALGKGMGGEFRAPLAMAVIGGLVTSTLLSLFVIPALHCILSDTSDRVGGWLRRRLRLNQSEEVPA